MGSKKVLIEKGIQPKLEFIIERTNTCILSSALSVLADLYKEEELAKLLVQKAGMPFVNRVMHLFNHVSRCFAYPACLQVAFPCFLVLCGHSSIALHQHPHRIDLLPSNSPLHVLPFDRCKDIRRFGLLRGPVRAKVDV